MDDEEYSVSDSEDDYSREDKLLLENARNSMKRKEIFSDEEVYGFEESDSEDEINEKEEDEENEDIDMRSDLEDEEQLHDDRAWGKRKKSFYNTDFVDQDYDGIYQGAEAEIAELEEQEARNIQKRLAEQLKDADFSIIEAINIAEATEAIAQQEKISSDLTKLSKRQKLDLLEKESPEFFVLIQDFKEKLEEAEKFLPVINYFEKRCSQFIPAIKFLQTKLNIILNYCTNISYYLLLKAKRIPIKNHPVLKSLFQYKKLLIQLEDVNRTVIQPQLNKILKIIESGKEIPINEKLLKKKTTLKVLLKQNQKREKKAVVVEKKKEEMQKDNKIEFEEENIKEAVTHSDGKRAITYEIAKNKGLIPKRSKAQRNPRVKHRKKYEKAKIRRRGQVRTPRAEIPVYGGEPTGIKIRLTKSIKL